MQPARRERKRYWWVAAILIPIVILVLAGIFGFLATQITGGLGAAAGVLTAAAGLVGVLRISTLNALTRGSESWGDLMWNRAFAVVVARETLLVDEVLPWGD